MTYNPKIPPRLVVDGGVDGSESGCSIWAYSSVVDSLATVLGANYFSNGALFEMELGDIIIIYDVQNNVTALGKVSAISGIAVSVSLISSGSGGDIVAYNQISALSANAAMNNGYIFLSSGSAKILNAPPATGSQGVIESADGANDAFNNPINFVPNGGDTVVGNQNQIYTNYGSARWRDVKAGLWLNI